MDRGRDVLLDFSAGLDDGELVTACAVATCSNSAGDVADEAADVGSLESRRGGGDGVAVSESGPESGFEGGWWKVSFLGDDAGVGVLESLRGAES